MPRLKNVQIDDYEEMLEMSTNRRQRYYEYLHATITATMNEDVCLQNNEDFDLIFHTFNFYSIDKKDHSSTSL